ncbi:MAG TPA: hypothetical protein PKA49_01155 [Tepidiformaceae bacterium]|nr:hypothetical protein [Tepidiformaceae bacterium]
MKTVALAMALLLAALAQAAVAPLFPLSAAVPDLCLLALVMVVAFGGPRAAMVAVPVVALGFAFASNRSAALVLLAYLPLLPLAFVLEEGGLPLNRFAQTLVAGVATGLWARLALALGAMADGAAPQPGLLVAAVLVPGVMLDLLMLTMAYLPLRALGVEPRALEIPRSRYGWS